MASNPIFYESITVLNRDSHRRLKLASGKGRFSFAARTHVIPAVVDEFATSSRHMPIVFSPGATFASPVFLVGRRPGQNLFVSEKGDWTGRYVPAYVRRYPFMLGENGDAGSLTCIDQKYFRTDEDSGVRLFNDDGTNSPLLDQKIREMNDYFAAAKRTEAFAKMLHEMQLLQAVTIELTNAAGQNSALHGLLVVDEAKFNAQPAADHLKLRENGFLGPIYAHLLSLGSVDALREAAPPAVTSIADASPELTTTH